MQEGDYRFALSEPVWLHFLGHKTMVKEEEADVAARNTCWCSCYDCSSRRNRCSRYDYWYEIFDKLCRLKIIQTAILGIPVWVGRKLHTRFKGASKHKRNCAVMGGVAASVSEKYQVTLNVHNLFQSFLMKTSFRSSFTLKTSSILKSAFYLLSKSKAALINKINLFSLKFLIELKVVVFRKVENLYLHF